MDVRDRDEQIIRLLNEFIGARDKLSADATTPSGIFGSPTKTAQADRLLQLYDHYSASLMALLPLVDIPQMQAFSELIGSRLSVRKMK